MKHLPTVGLRPHRDGGRILEVVGPGEGMWMFSASYARRRRNRFGQRIPFQASLTIYEGVAAVMKEHT